MNKVLLLLLLVIPGIKAKSQTIPSYTADQLIARASNTDTTYIINFWASWCGPCVAELPQFDKLEQKYRKQKVKVLMVSFDFKDSYPAKLSSYVAKKKIQPEVVWFSETNANEFIPKIENSWSGGIPGTLIIDKKSGFRQFIERPVTAKEIGRIISQLGN